MSVIMGTGSSKAKFAAHRCFEVTDGYIDCPEIVGKVVKSLKLYPGHGNGPELLIDFEDGTSFSCTVENKPSVTASLIRGGVGGPNVLRDYL